MQQNEVKEEIWEQKGEGMCQGLRELETKEN